MDPATMSAVASEFMKQGFMGAVIVMLLFVIAALYKKNGELNEGRLTDKTTFMDKYVTLLEKMMESQHDTNTILEVIKDRLSQGKKPE